MYCKKCGAQYSDSRRSPFCASCGAPLPKPAPAKGESEGEPKENVVRVVVETKPAADTPPDGVKKKEKQKKKRSDFPC